MPENSQTRLYRARWVLPDAFSCIQDGALAVCGDAICEVGPFAALQKQFPQTEVFDCQEAALMPGLANCHTHLELTVMRGFLEDAEHDFFAWLGKLTAARNERLTPDDLYISALWGLAEAARAGITCVGDACAEGLTTMRALRETGLRGVAFLESFGPDPALARENVAILQENVAAMRELETGLARVGVSPHAPYTVSAPQLELIADFALTENLPVMTHTAESAAEDELLRHGGGPFAERLKLRGIAWNTPQTSPAQYLKQTGLLAARPLLAHCVRVDDADLATLAEHGATIAHCPKSNAKLHHGRAPFAAFLRHGLRVGLGSDSVASNNTCDILEEARFATLLARANGDNINLQQAFHAATAGGAAALRIEQQTGSLAPGMQADFIAVALDEAHQTPVHDPRAAVITASTGRDVRLTVVAGREIYREGRMLTVDENELRAKIAEIAAKLK
jgi:5-methylthioadenosine/S-adenosylhomocysteine deaminase